MHWPASSAAQHLQHRPAAGLRLSGQQSPALGGGCPRQLPQPEAATAAHPTHMVDGRHGLLRRFVGHVKRTLDHLPSQRDAAGSPDQVADVQQRMHSGASAAAPVQRCQCSGAS